MSLWTFFIGAEPPSKSQQNQPHFVPNEVVENRDEGNSNLAQIANCNNLTPEQVEELEYLAEQGKLQLGYAKRAKKALASIAKSQVASKKALLEGVGYLEYGELEKQKMIARSQRLSGEKRRSATRLNDLLAGVNSIGRGL